MELRPIYDAELGALSAALIEMGGRAAHALDLAMDALTRLDKDLARQVMRDDQRIDDLEHDIEQRCLRLLLKQQPVAGDLRKIGTAMKMVTDIERIGDAAADICENILYLTDCTFPDIRRQVLDMAKDARSMVDDSIRAYVQEDLALARATIDRDDVVDAAFARIREALAGEIGSDKHQMDAIIDYLMIIKYLERVGDHAVNICEWVEFNQTGIHKEGRIF